MASDIRPSGRFPVIDQGQSFIAGYSDDEDRVVRDDLPVVVFGDHTRIFKFVDFPFIVGADGTKLLKPREDLFDPRFFYFALLNLDIPNRGYNRHFSILREKHLAYPDRPEQREIAAVLGLVQRAIEQQERLVALTGELKRTLMHKLFTEGLRGEPQKQTEIGPVPESWDAIRIDGIGKLVTGATPKTSIGEYYSPEEIDFITPADLSKTRKIYSSERKISRCGLESIRGLPSDAILCVCIGSSIGKVGMTSKTESATNQQINAIICKDSYNPAFVYYLLDYHATYWRGFATFGPVPILSKSRFGSIRIAVPPDREEQDEIANRLTTLDNSIEIYSRRKDLLNDLFRTLLHQLMTALIRVNDLDLSEIEAAVGEA